MSAKPAPESAALSGGIGEWLAKLFHTDYQSWAEEDWLKHVDMVNRIVRKVAHLVEYAILGVLLCMDAILLGHETDGKIAEGENKVTRRFPGKTILVSWVIGTVYAASDEFHQFFVEGRSAEVRDVLIDSTGVLIGSLIVAMVAALRRKRHEPRSFQKTS